MIDKNMEILAIIPARGGSKGIPRKNIKMLAGKPLLAYTIDAALKSKYVTRTVVSTEDIEIKNIATSLGVDVIDRPIELAQDTTKTAPVLLNVLEQLEKQNYCSDVVVLLQATCPLRNEKELDEALELYFSKQNDGIDSVFAGKEIGTTHSKWRKYPANSKEVKYECLFDYRQRPRRQDEDCHYPMYQETGATYIIKTDVLKRVKDFIGEKPEIYTGGSWGDIDVFSDFEEAEKILNSRNRNNK